MSETVFIGMDLGTSRTSITTSTGVRTTVWSYVGYALDHVSRKHLGGRDKVFGQEAVENRMAVNLIRPLDKGVIQDDDDCRRAVKDLLEHIIAQADIPSGSTIYGVIGAPAEASVDSKAHILSAASEFMDSIIVCSEPFAVAYGLDFLSDTLVVDIGAGTVDLCRVHGTMPKPEDQRTHHYAGDAIDHRISELLTENHPEAQFSSNMVREIKENYACVGTHMDPVITSFPVEGKPTEFDITAEVSEACSGIVNPTVEALQDLIATYDPEFQQKMRNHVLLGGGGSQITGLSRAFEEALSEYGGGKVRTVEEPQYAGSNGALKIALDMPEEFWKEFIEQQSEKA
ncbi:MAG: rod shape-determining protein [Planctomycetota bacterium]|nr:rod shape-determining protein [Planctomycetota bacterium]